ncbi:MAG: MBL fold metallo-hydrolase [Ignavibacteriota bacterium]
MQIKQIRSTDDTGTLTYIVSDENQKVAAVIDPNIEDIPIILEALKKDGLTLLRLIDTHTHADHISGTRRLKELTLAQVIMHKDAEHKYQYVDQGDEFGIGDILRENVKVIVDRFVDEGDEISIGDVRLKVLHTPGHTNDHISLLANGHLFTGDLLLVGQAGRSDLPGGNTEDQYDTLFTKILKLPDETIIHPGHDYEGNENTTLATEKETNPFLVPRSKAEYKEFVQEFFPPMADTSEGKVVLQCGTKRIANDHEGYKNIKPSELKRMLAEDPSLVLIDVREPSELRGLGAIEGVVNIPMNKIIYGKQNLDEFKSKKVIMVCQTGGRSMEAAHVLASRGNKNVYNLVGGTSGWMMAGFPVSKPKRKKIFSW